MNKTPIDEKQANNLVKRKNIWWDGWDLMFWYPSNNADLRKQGAFRNGKWGIQTRVPVNQEGKWEVLTRYVRPSK